ncbi:latrophilin Cirl-like [Uloborus diversus]|uniref:latrophilin Cirl-like n=1 Tax=Uloborus diversus TaxID=327109 RepID=UPI002409B323|nr:latrophilin Cirl-like [Uloborus diversus]
MAIVNINRDSETIPKFLQQKRLIRSAQAHRIYNRTEKALLRERIHDIRKDLAKTSTSLLRLHLSIANSIRPADWDTVDRLTFSSAERKMECVSARQKSKFNTLNNTQAIRPALDISRVVVNKSNRVLTTAETSILAKGGNFAISMNSIPTEDIIANIESSLRQLPQAEAEEIRREASRILHKAKPPRSNVSNAERKAIKSLNEDKSIVILPADKGNATTVLNTEDYRRKIRDLLDPTIYVKLRRDPTSRILKKTNSLIMKSTLPEKTKETISSSEALIPRLYGLPKIHKEELPLRPIVSAINSPTHLLSKHLASLLKPHVGATESFVRDSSHFIEKLKTYSLQSTDILPLFPDPLATGFRSSTRYRRLVVALRAGINGGAAIAIDGAALQSGDEESVLLLLWSPGNKDSSGYWTTYACEGGTLHLSCSKGRIHLIRANYGRFSISICNDHGNLDWRVNCKSHHSFLIMQERCSFKLNCSVNVSSNTFLDPCPGTLKYLEVQYHCGTGMASWHCKFSTVQWSPESPDLSQCYSLWLENLKERIKNGEPIVSVTSDLALMTLVKPLFSEDLKAIGKLIQDVLYKSVSSMENFLDTWHRYNVLRELLQLFVQTLSNLLEEKQAPAWSELAPTDRQAVVSRLLQGLDESALLLADTSSDDGSFTLVKNNILLSLQVQKAKTAKNLHFPLQSDLSQEAEKSHWGNMQDSLLLPEKSLQNNDKNDSNMKVLNEAFLGWSAQGCWVESSNRSHTVCLCNHLTNFALIMEVQDVDTDVPVDVDILGIVSTVGCVLASVALFLTVFILFIISLDSTHDSVFIHRNLFVCLFITELLFLGGIKQTKDVIVCAIIAGSLQYLLLVTFSWMFFECYHQYLMVLRSCDSKESKVFWYYILAYALPGLITGISAAVNPTSYGTKYCCWLQADNYFVFNFVGPGVSIILGGLVFLCIAFCMISFNFAVATTTAGSNDSRRADYKCWNRRSLFMIILLSITWALGVIFMNNGTLSVAYAFAMCNSLLGISSFLLYCVFNEKTKKDWTKLIQREFCFKKKKQQDQLSTQLSVSQTVSTSGQEVSQEFWRCKDRWTRVKSYPRNNATDRCSTKPVKKVKSFAEHGKQSDAHCVNKKSASSDVSRCTSNDDDEEEHRNSSSSNEYQAINMLNECERTLNASESGHFVDHIYETIDDLDGQSYQRHASLGNQFEEKSGSSRRYSSSYGHEHRSLINSSERLSDIELIKPNGQQRDFCTLNQYLLKSKSKATSNSTNFSFDGSCTPEELLLRKTNSFDRYGSPLPDLLRKPAEHGVVLAVLEKDEVVSRIQQDKILLHPELSLNTYC